VKIYDRHGSPVRGGRGLFDAHWTVGDLVRFHTAHKLRLLGARARGVWALMLRNHV
jgi:hypothetical protein